MTDDPDMASGGGDFPGGDMALAGEYTLGVLTREEARAFEGRMMTDPALRAQYADWAERLVELSAGEDVAPPARLKALIDANIAPVTAASAKTISPWRRLLGGMVAVAILALAVFLNPFDDPGRVDFTARLEGSSGLQAVVMVNGETGAMSLSRVAGAPPVGLVHELWMIRPGGAPRSLGLIGDDGTFAATWPDSTLEAVRKGEVQLAISEENPGGAANGVPTTVLAVALVEMDVS